MTYIYNWLSTNKEWVFSGVGVLILSSSVPILRIFFFKKTEATIMPTNNTNTNSNVVNITNLPPQSENIPKTKRSLDERKKITNILFIDDDTTFKVVKILRKSGWVNTKIIKDIKSITDPLIKDTNIFFVDIQGVAKDLFPKDEGLGLVGLLKDKYPSKKVVVYSSQRTGDRFNELLKKADDSLGKDADPYQFENLIDRFSEDIFE